MVGDRSAVGMQTGRAPANARSLIVVLLLAFGIAFPAGPPGAQGRPATIDSIRRLQQEIADDSNREPTLEAIQPLLDELQVLAKTLAALQVDGNAFPPVVVYFCSDPHSMDCPGMYADDTIHLYEAGYLPQFKAVRPGARLMLSPEMSRTVEMFRGNTSELHRTGSPGLLPVPVDASGMADLRGARGQGWQVLVAFAESADRRVRFKFVWLVE